MFALWGARIEAGEEFPAATNEEEEIFQRVVRRRVEQSPGFLTRTVEAIRGVSEETTTGVHRLYELSKKGKLPFPAINVNTADQVEFDNLYGCRESWSTRSVARPTSCWPASRLRCGFGDVGRQRGFLRQGGARVLVTEIDRSARFSAMEGYELVTWRKRHARRHLCNRTGIWTYHRRSYAGEKNMAIVCNIGHFDSEIQISGLQNRMGRDQASGR